MDAPKKETSKNKKEIVNSMVKHSHSSTMQQSKFNGLKMADLNQPVKKFLLWSSFI